VADGWAERGPNREFADEQSFELFFRSHYVELVRALCVVVRDEGTAEELAQEAFARVYLRWERVSRMERPMGYTYRIALNLNRRRLRPPKVWFGATAGEGDRATDLDPSIVAIRRTDVLRAIRRLPVKLREAVLLVDLLDASPDEAGKILGIRPQSVRVRTHRARALLRGWLEGSDE
jgi:RNA polymerase sigma factor (sigma-70 family)